MSRPTDAGSFAEAVYAEVAPLTTVDSSNGWSLLLYLGALGQMLQDLDYLAHARSDGVPWRNLVDLDHAPDNGLPWLGQFSGVRIDTALSAAAQRQQIRDRIGWGRGSVSGFINSVKPYLTGTQTITLVERTGADAYAFSVNTYADETPSETAMRAIMLTNKPAGLVMTYTVLPGSPSPTLYSDLFAESRDNTYGDIYSLWGTYADIR